MKRVLTKMEYEVMRVLWESDKPLSSREIMDSSAVEFKQSTVQTVLRTLLKEGWIEVGNVSIHTKVLAREFIPVVSNEEYAQSLLGKKGKFSMASRLIQQTDNVEELERLGELIEKRLKEKQ